jgi:hypothetical protein
VNLATYNGRVTVENPVTGEHRVFEVRTQPLTARFAPGKRVVSLLKGRGLRDETAFGFVLDDGSVRLWRKFRGRQPWAGFARVLGQPGDYTGRLNYRAEVRCRRCNRELLDPESIRVGLGPVCRGDRT